MPEIADQECFTSPPNKTSDNIELVHKERNSKQKIPVVDRVPIEVIKHLITIHLKAN